MKTPPSTLVLAILVGFAGCLESSVIPPEGFEFTPNSREWGLYLGIRKDAEQKRIKVVLDPRLSAAARKHAEDMQKRKFFDHANPDNLNANGRATNAGYPLPNVYGPTLNYIESLAGSNVDTPDDVISRWRFSEKHAEHIFGKLKFYADQVVIGVGQAPSTGQPWATYVFLSAPPPSGQRWSGNANGVGGNRFEIDPKGKLHIGALNPGAVVEVWKSDNPLQDWVPLKIAVAGTDGRIEVGQKGNNGPAFFRLSYFQR